MYWDDWKLNSVFSSDKDNGIMIRLLVGDLQNLMDLKVFAHSVQEGTNACSTGKKCSHICVGAPKGEYSCLCPINMVKSPTTNECLCSGGVKPYRNNTCPQVANACGRGFFACANKLCIPTVSIPFLKLHIENEND